MCVSTIYRSNFTGPKWEVEWTEKETWDLCLHSNCHSQHLHPGWPDFGSLLSLYWSPIISGAHENPHLYLSHWSTFHGDCQTLTLDCQAKALLDALDSGCHAVIISPCLCASQGAVGGGGTLWRLARFYRDLSFRDVVIWETVLYPRAYVVLSNLPFPFCCIAVINENNPPS